MRPHWRQHKTPISFRQLMLWRELHIDIGQIEAKLRPLPDTAAPSPLVIELVRLMRADLCRLTSREVAARALRRPLPDAPGRALIDQSLTEAHMALNRFREAHSAPWSERDDAWLVHED